MADFDVEKFNGELSSITSSMAKGFARAFNDTSRLQQLGRDIVHSMTMVQTIVDRDDINVIAEFRGGKADLFARTFDSCLLHFAGIHNSRRYPILSPETQENIDRKITYSVPKRDTAQFIESMKQAQQFILTHKEPLSALYETGISAQQEIGAGQRGVATKYFIFVRKPFADSNPEFRLDITTNNPRLMEKIESLVEQKSHDDPSIDRALKITKVPSFNANGKDYAKGVEIKSINSKGDQLLKEAVQAVSQEMGFRTRA